MKLFLLLALALPLLQTSVALFLLFIVACATVASAFFVNSRVRLRKGVTANARCLTPVDRDGPHSSQEILPVRHGFEMRRIHAGSHPTEVIEHETSWNLTDEGLVSKTMGARKLCPNKQASISLIVDRANPEPASTIRLGNGLLPESFFWSKLNLKLHREASYASRCGEAVGYWPSASFYCKAILSCFLVLSPYLAAQESAKPSTEAEAKPPQDALKARIAYLEQRLALTEQKCTALANFYAAQQALDQQKPPEPPKDEKK